jgi:hypothetical protein
MKDINKKATIAIMILLIALGSAQAVSQLVALQGKVTKGETLVDDGNLTITIYDAAAGGNLVYNSSTLYNNSIQSGFFDIMLGSRTELNLEQEKLYYMDLEINGEDIDFDGAERKQFMSPVGTNFTAEYNYTFHKQNKTLFIDSANNRVGIGTPNPDEKLHLEGGSFLTKTTSNSLREVGYINDTESQGTAHVLDYPIGLYVSGKYAYVTSYSDDGLSIIDISDPTNPNEVGYINDTEQQGTAQCLDSASDIFVSGEYAYVTAPFDDALSIIDVSNKSNPVEVGYINDTESQGTAQLLDGAQGVYVSGKYAYVTANSDHGLSIIDVSDPTNPTEVGYINDTVVGGTANCLNGSYNVYVSGKYAYVTAFKDHGLSIIDISDPTNPNEVGCIQDTTAGGTAQVLQGARAVYVSGKYAYIGAQDDIGLSIINISDPSNPTEVGYIQDGIGAQTLNAPVNVYVSGKYAYVAVLFEDALSIIDISDPTNPIETAFIKDTASGGTANCLDYAFDVHVSGKYAYVVAGVDDALSIIDIGGIDAPAATIGDLAVGTLDVWENAQIANNLYVDGGLNVGPGGLKSDGPASIMNNTLVVNPDGKVGIGTSSPSEKLNLAGGSFLINTTSNSLREVGYINDTEVGGTAQLLDGAYNIYVSGKYAYVTSLDDDGLSIIDISDPTNPTEVGYINDTERQGTAQLLDGAQGIYVSGKYAYIISNEDKGLSIIDISNSSNPTEVGYINDTEVGGTAQLLDAARGVYVSGKYAYVTSVGDDGLSIIDISDPTNPTEVGYINDTEVGGTAQLLDYPTGVYVSGKYAYVTSLSDDGLSIIDISDPTNPAEVGYIQDTEQGGTAQLLDGAVRVYVSGKYAYVAAFNDDGLSIINISDPTNPTEVAYINDTTAGGTAQCLNQSSKVEVSGKYAYITANNDDGISIIDISDPTNPVEVACIQDTEQEGTAQLLDYAYDVHVSGKYAYITSRDDDGLSIIDIGGIDAPAATIGDLAVGTLDVWENAQIANNLYVDGSLNVGPGGIKSDGPASIMNNTLVVNPDGKVGIGTSSPSEKLNLAGGSFLINTTTNSLREVGYMQDSESGGTASCLDTVRGLYISGKYAYATSWSDDALTIIDISDPSNPKEVGHINDTEVGGTAQLLDGAEGVYVSGNYAYVASRNDDGLSIIDVSNKSNPVELGYINDSNVGGTAQCLNGAWDIYISGKYAYVTGSSDDGLSIIDISDPTNPKEVGCIQDTEQAGTAQLLDGAYDVYVSGEYAYITSPFDHGLSIIDVSDPTNPQEVGYINDTNVGGTANLLNGSDHVYVSGKYAYVTADYDNGLSIINISDPTNPTEVAYINDSITKGTASCLRRPHGVYVSGKYAYVVSDGDDALSIIDISNPEDPREVACIQDDNLGGTATILNGVDEVYVSGKYAYVSSANEDGLSIIDIGGIDAPAATIGDLATSTLDVWENAQIANNLYVDGGLNVGPGGIKSDGPASIMNNTLVVNPDGKVGIGTNSPKEELEVAGNINVTGTVATDSGCGIPNAVLQYERGTLTANTGLSIGNGGTYQGLPMACSGVATAISAMCATASGSAYTSFEVRVNGAAQTCDTSNVNSANTGFTTSGCSVSFSQNDIVGCYAKTLTGTPSDCTCSVYVQFS